MSGCCNPSARMTARQEARRTAGPSNAVPAPTMFKVVLANGRETGRKFQSKVSAAAYADRVGGIVQPA
jgi:hypothetical protein